MNTPATTSTDSQPAAAPATQSPEDLLKIAADVDAGGTPPAPITEKPADKPSDKPADAGTPKPTDKGSAEDKTKDGQKPDDKKTDPNAKPETAYTKAQKERERQENLLKGFEEEKQKFRAEIQREREQLAAERQKLEEQRTRKPEGPGPEHYEQLAKEYEEAGNTKMAEAARQRAKEVREEQARAQTPTKSMDGTPAPNSPEFKTKWNETIVRLESEFPELKDPKNPLVVQTNLLINDKNFGRFFKSHTDGVQAALEVAKIMHLGNQAIEKTKGLEEKLTAANAEVERLTKLTSITGAPPGAAPSSIKLEDMTPAQREAHMMKLAQAADGGGT